MPLPVPTETDYLRPSAFDEASTTTARQPMTARWVSFERIDVGPFRQAYGALLRGQTLEVGVGQRPQHSLLLRRRSRDSSGSISSEEMLRQCAHERAVNSGIPFTLMQANAEHLLFPHATFILSLISLAFLTTPDPVKALLELAEFCCWRKDRDVEHVALHGLPARGAATGSFTASMSGQLFGRHRLGHLRPVAVAGSLDRRDPTVELFDAVAVSW